ncbi:hypothetical protein [Streptomyces spiramyceticus]|uniref:hypothetical protein n=1 Tax=Streptomyces spiramyceticus TaxID=299717 RepID=UPI00237C46D2|nr:hypothetical protein [Streptomyces spiramyceticus]
MTECLKGEHEFPVEDDEGAHCEEHGVTLLWHGPPITPENLTPDTPTTGPAQVCGAPARTPLPGSAAPH